MRKFHLTRSFAAVFALFVLTGCGGGAGGPESSATSGGNNGLSNNNSPGNNNGNAPLTLQVQGAAAPTMGPNAALEETGANYYVTDRSGVTTAPVGTVFPLLQSVMTFAAASLPASPADTVNTGGATLTYQGTSVVNSTSTGQYELKIPALNIDVTTALVTYPGAHNSNNYFLTLQVDTLPYTFAGNWLATPTGIYDNGFYGTYVAGFQTPVTALPTSGQATYSGTASGTILWHSPVAGGPYNYATVGGNASTTVNFGTGVVSGSITNAIAAQGGNFGFPWNDVRLTGTLSGASISGTTAAASVPATAAGLNFDISSTGTFKGALYGPAGQNLGAVWSLHDPTGEGKTAIGTILGSR